MIRLNLGCGRMAAPGWTNIDARPLPGVDIVADLTAPLPFDADTVDEMLLSHVIEHLREPLGLMAELHRIARPGGLLTVRVPYGSSDEAWADQTHVRPYFIGSWDAFAQPYYWRADYGYRGDWQPLQVHLLIDARYRGRQASEMMDHVALRRNVVREMIAVLTAVKPARPAQRELLEPPRVTLDFA